ncbi:MAG: methionine gamma-lyase family protein [Clostridia bacterium]|nr:methionine gamma-lyase family protein [Clostridia bacterium]
MDKILIDKLLQQKLDIHSNIIEFVEDAEADIADALKDKGIIKEYNQYKVLHAMQEARLSDRHFVPSTGYGYSDQGREILEEIYSIVFGSEDALVRPNIVSGTHAISLCLYSLLNPGEHMISAAGAPYDTLQKVIGLKGDREDTLIKDGVIFETNDLNQRFEMDIDSLMNKINDKTSLILFQRSRGYDWRKSLSIREIGHAINSVKQINEKIICMVDNCYGEFVDYKEPIECGADIVAGSLIKNPGGGLAPTGGYIVGKSKLINKIANRLTCPGLGKDLGSYNASYRPFIQGLFMAPHVVYESVKGAMLCASVFEKLGFEVMPGVRDKRNDITQAVKFNNEEMLVAFCQGIQEASPVDSNVLPIPGDMPGYQNQVIMAAGTFIQGASIELSADGPIREPYIAYVQGGLNYEHVKVGIMIALKNLIDKKLIEL